MLSHPNKYLTWLKNNAIINTAKNYSALQVLKIKISVKIRSSPVVGTDAGDGEKVLL